MHGRIIKSTLLLAVLLIVSPARAGGEMKPVLSLDSARGVIEAALHFAAANNAPGGAVAVVDDGGNLVALERLDRTFAAAALIAWEKARAAAHFQKPTRTLEDTINQGRTAMVTVPGYTLLRGGVPIVIEGRVVGAIGVSGAASAQQDDEIAMAGAGAVPAAGGHQ